MCANYTSREHGHRMWKRCHQHRMGCAMGLDLSLWERGTTSDKSQLRKKKRYNKHIQNAKGWADIFPHGVLERIIRLPPAASSFNEARGIRERDGR